jgi:hypothetical protein
MIISKMHKMFSIFDKSSTKSTSQCKRFRNWLYSALSRHINPEAAWLQKHIASCPRCRRRLLSRNKVDLALSFMKSQPLSLDLLMRANEQAIGVLKHSLRRAPKADKLKQIKPEPKLVERLYKHLQPVGNMAACIAILIMMKASIFSSMDSVQAKGQKVIRQYYTDRLGEDLAEEIFPSNSGKHSSRYSG